MPRTKEQNTLIKEATKQKIKEAGLKLFSHKGLAAVSINEIANEADISIGLMYHYYKSKEELYSELVGTAIESSTQALQDIYKMEVNPAKKIAFFVQQVLSDSMTSDLTSQYYLLMTQAMINDHLPDKAKNHLKNVYESFNITKQIIKEGQKLNEIKEGDETKLTILLLSSINGLCTYKLMMGNQFIMPDMEMVTDMIVRK